MFLGSRFFSLSAAVALCVASAPAQNVISAKSGLVHYIEGDVAVNGTPVADKAGTFADVKKDQQLNTTLGRAEVLLTPGVFLRVAEQSSVKMLNTNLSDTRVEFLSGNAMVESDTPMKDNLVTVIYKDYATTFPKHGLYEFQANPPQLRVYSGEAVVTAGGQTVTVHEGKLLTFTAALAQERFDPKMGDSLYRWSKVRSEYISVANVSAANSAGASGYGNGFLQNGFGNGLLQNGFGNWFYNPYYGMYTYLPFAGTSYSPFGFAYYSPYTVYQAYQPYSSYAASRYVPPRHQSHSAPTAPSHSGLGVSTASYGGGGVPASSTVASRPTASYSGPSMGGGFGGGRSSGRGK